MPEPESAPWRALSSGLVLAEPRGAAWRLTVSLPDGTQRQLDTSTCEAAARAAHLVLRLSGPPPSSPPPLVEARARPVTPAPAPRWTLAAEVSASALQHPGLTPRLGARGWLELEALRLSVAVSAGVPADYPTVSSELRFVAHPVITAEVTGCAVGQLGPISLGPCVLGSVGALSLTGQGFTGARSTTVAVAYAGVDLLVWLPLGRRLLLAAKGGPRLGLVQPDTQLGGTTVFRPGHWSAELGLDVGYRF